jgi:hypothetical protein
MITHEQMHETKTIPASEFDLANHYKEIETQEEHRLDTPELDDILKVAVADGLLAQEKFDELQAATGDERYRLKEEIFGNLNPRDLRKGFIERNQLGDTLSSEAFQEATFHAAEAMDMTQPQELPKGHYIVVIEHGGLNLTPWLRVKKGLDPLMDPDGERSADVSAAVGGARLVNDAEKEKAASYIADYTRKDEIKYESDLMDAAVEHWLREHDLEDIIEQSEIVEGTARGETVSGVPYWMRLYDLQAAKADGRLPATMPNVIVSLNAPMDATRQIRRLSASGDKNNIMDMDVEDLIEMYEKRPKVYKDRPDTEDPLDMVQQIVDLKPGDRVGSISHHPVSKAQLLITKEAFLDDGVIVEEGAYKSDALINNPDMRFSEICKVVSSAERLRKHAKEKLIQLQ